MLFRSDVFYVERKVIENKNVVEFELGTPLDIEGVMLPRRQTVANTCYWRYRSPECGYAQSKVVADSTDTLLGVTGQRYTGAWSVGTLYSRSDVVYILSNGIRRHFILTVAQAQGETFQPPNPSFWKEDRCSKRVAGCKLRFDPQGLNSPLPFGGFPGTARIPLS